MPKVKHGLEQLDTAKENILTELASAGTSERDTLLTQLEQIQRIQLSELSIAKGKRLAAE